MYVIETRRCNLEGFNIVLLESTANKFKNPSLPADAQIPEKAYNINQDYFLHVAQTVPFDLNQVFFTTEVREDGLYFKVVKEKETPV
jgi:hypothetical protein